jgi:hypothetical protein
LYHFSEYRRYDHEEANVATPKQTAAPGAYASQLAVHPYLELPPTQLMKRIPELKGISPAPDQQALPMILQQTGKQVDLIAHEDITQQLLANRTSFRRIQIDDYAVYQALTILYMPLPCGV